MHPEHIDDSEWLKSMNSVPVKRQLMRIFSNKKTVFVQDCLNCFVSNMTCILYIYNTYNWMYFRGPQGWWYSLYLLVVHIYFLLDFCVRCFTANHFVPFLETFGSMIELLTTIPFGIMFLFAKFDNFWFRFFIMTDLCRIYFNERLIRLIEGNMYREMLIILNNAVFLVIFASGLI